MTIKGLGNCRLWTIIQQHQFFTCAEDDLLKELYCCFKSEIDRLKKAYAIERGTPPSIPVNGTGLPATPSEILFGEDYDEVNRTLTGVLALRWIMTNDYERFIAGQNGKAVLTRDSFQWLKQYYTEHLSDPEDLFCLILSMIVNDLGKDPDLSEDYFEKTKKIISKANHDTILLEAAREGLVPCLDYLDDVHRQDVMLGLELGSELNAGQLAQAENVPVNLEGLLMMHGNERAFNLKFMEQLLDVAGAQGHIRSDGAKNLIEPVFQAFKTVQEVSLCIIKRECTLRQGYDRVLTKRGALLEAAGYRNLSVHDDEERALLRLLTMGRTATLAQAELFEKAFNNLDPPQKTLLVEGLNIDGDQDDQTAVVPYYMPAMLAEAIRSTRDSPKQMEALTSLMRYLARVLNWKDNEEAQPQIDVHDSAKTEYHKTWPIESESTRRASVASTAGTEQFRVKEGRVFERNMIKAREMINSRAFRERPEIMDNLDPPEGHLLKRRRTGMTV